MAQYEPLSTVNRNGKKNREKRSTWIALIRAR